MNLRSLGTQAKQDIWDVLVHLRRPTDQKSLVLWHIHVFLEKSGVKAIGDAFHSLNRLSNFNYDPANWLLQQRLELHQPQELVLVHLSVSHKTLQDQIRPRSPKIK